MILFTCFLLYLPHDTVSDVTWKTTDLLLLHGVPFHHYLHLDEYLNGRCEGMERVGCLLKRKVTTHSSLVLIVKTSK